MSKLGASKNIFLTFFEHFYGRIINKKEKRKNAKNQKNAENEKSSLKEGM